MTVTERIRLERGGAACEIAPHLGGAILNLRVNGVDLLRPTKGMPGDVRETACFLMTPFANRIDHGRVIEDGAVVEIGSDPDGEPHALHGHGWRSAWRTAAVSADAATLEYERDGEGWPWPYRVRQSLRLKPTGIVIDVTIRNLHASRVMPAGTGLHPYFLRKANSSVRMTSERRWETDSSGLSIRDVDDHRFGSGRSCPMDRLIGLDHFFVTPDASITIDEAIELRGNAMVGAHIYAPRSADFFCVEPVSHVPNSFGRGDYRAADLLRPGGIRTWTFSIFDARRPEAPFESATW